MRLVTTGSAPQRAQRWKSAEPVPKRYVVAAAGSRIRILNDPPGHDVQTAPCFVQNEQVHARAGISAGSGTQSSKKEKLPQ